MRRVMVALGLLIGLVTAATAGTWQGFAIANSAFNDQTPIIRTACGYTDRFCPHGLTRSCAPDGRCWCAHCERERYYNEPRYNEGPRYNERPRYNEGVRYYNEPRGNEGPRYNEGARYYNEPRGNEGLNLQFLFGGRSDDRRYSPPNKAQFQTANGCPNGYTVQDGLCKPYTGR